VVAPCRVEAAGVGLAGVRGSASLHRVSVVHGLPKRVDFVCIRLWTVCCAASDTPELLG
jgi:hypothetical protein